MSETSHLPDSGFGKIFQTTYTGSLMGSGAVVMAVWPYVIANAKPPGVVELVPRYIAAVIGCNPADVSNAIEFLQAPDPESRSDIEEGRRLVHLTGHMYRVPTWSNYREKRDDEARKVYFREAKRKSRESKTVKDNLGKSNLSTQAEAEAEADTKKSKPVAVAPVLPFDSIEFATAWAEWQQHRKEKRQNLTPTTIKKQFLQFGKWGETKSIAAIELAIEKGWTGLFEPKTETPVPSKRDLWDRKPGERVQPRPLWD